jgi:hypothetical protein
MGNVELPLGIRELEWFQNFFTSSFDSLFESVKAGAAYCSCTVTQVGSGITGRCNKMWYYPGDQVDAPKLVGHLTLSGENKPGDTIVGMVQVVDENNVSTGTGPDTWLLWGLGSDIVFDAQVCFGTTIWGDGNDHKVYIVALQGH